MFGVFIACCLARNLHRAHYEEVWGRASLAPRPLPAPPPADLLQGHHQIHHQRAQSPVKTHSSSRTAMHTSHSSHSHSSHSHSHGQQNTLPSHSRSASSGGHQRSSHHPHATIGRSLSSNIRTMPRHTRTTPPETSFHVWLD